MSALKRSEEGPQFLTTLSVHFCPSVSVKSNAAQGWQGSLAIVVKLSGALWHIADIKPVKRNCFILTKNKSLELVVQSCFNGLNLMDPLLSPRLSHSGHSAALWVEVFTVGVSWVFMGCCPF